MAPPSRTDPSERLNRRRARGVISDRIRGGWLAPAQELQCVDCGAQATQYDHYLGYRPEHWATVEPVCTQCHAKREVARMTHCMRGHELTDENTYRRRNGRRMCRECQRQRDKGRMR